MNNSYNSILKKDNLKMDNRFELTFLQKKRIHKWKMSVVTVEMQIKSTLSYHFTHTRMAVILTVYQASTRMRRNWNTHTLPVRLLNAATLRNNLMVPWNIKYRIPYDPTIQLLGVYPEEMKTYVHTKTYTQMLTAVPFTTAKQVETTQISSNW